MLTSDDVSELVTDLLVARAADDRVAVTEMLLGLVTGPMIDGFNVMLVLAGAMAADMGTEPELGFHHIQVSHLGLDGSTREGSTLDLPGHVATFVQMVVAVANGDRHMARDLFIGFTGTDGQKALRLLTLALDEVAHQNGLCPLCGGDDFRENACAG